MLKVGSLEQSVMSIIKLDLAIPFKDRGYDALVERTLQQLVAINAGERASLDKELLAALDELRSGKYDRIAQKDPQYATYARQMDEFNGDGLVVLVIFNYISNVYFNLNLFLILFFFSIS